MTATATYCLWISAAVALLALLLLGLTFWSAQWPSVKGRVEASFVDKSDEWTAARDSSGTNTVYKKQKEEFAFAYSYEVGGQKYLGSNLKPFGDYNWDLRTGGQDGLPDSGKVVWSGARDLAQWYREGAVVEVYYCPFRPQWSCVEPGGFILPVLLLGVAGVLAYCGYH